MTSKNIYVMLVMIMTIVTGCAKTPAPAPAPAPPRQIRFSAEGLKYIKLTPLKYFIYKDSANQTTDSVVVTMSLLINMYVPPASEYYDFFGAGFYVDRSAYNTEHFTLMLTKKNAPVDSTWLTGRAGSVNRWSSSTDDGPIHLSDPNNKMIFRYPLCGCPEQVFLSSIVVEGRTYHSVIKNTDPLNDRSIYWAKDIGIIRMEINTLFPRRRKNTYTLLRHN